MPTMETNNKPAAEKPKPDKAVMDNKIADKEKQLSDKKDIKK